MKALSIKQPWAELIVSGKKDIENRNWSTKLRENILIHASKSFDKDGLKWVQDNMGLLLDKTEKDFDKGGFVGIVKISDCVSESKSKWFFGEYGRHPDYAYGIDWVIVGGESGNKARRMDLEWVRNIRNQCQEAGVKFFFKQFGSVLAGELGLTKTGHDINEPNFPREFKIRETL